MALENCELLSQGQSPGKRGWPCSNCGIRVGRWAIVLNEHSGDGKHALVLENGWRGQKNEWLCPGGAREWALVLTFTYELRWSKWEMSDQAWIDTFEKRNDYLGFNQHGGSCRFQVWIARLSQDGRQVIALQWTQWRQEASIWTWFEMEKSRRRTPELE